MQYQKHHLVEKVTSKKKIRNLVFFLSRAFVCLFMFWFWFTGFNFFFRGEGGRATLWKGGNPFPFGCRARRIIHDHLLPKFSCQLFSLYNNSFEVRSNHRIKRCCIYIKSNNKYYPLTY